MWRLLAGEGIVMTRVTRADHLTLALIMLAERGQRPRCGDPGDHDLWLSELAEKSALAVSLCLGCEVLAQCRESAEANVEKFGVWDALIHADPERPEGQGVMTRCLRRHTWRATASQSGDFVRVCCTRCGRGPGLIIITSPGITDIPTRSATAVLRDLHEGREPELPFRIDPGEMVAAAALLLKVVADAGRDTAAILDAIALGDWTSTPTVPHDRRQGQQRGPAQRPRAGHLLEGPGVANPESTQGRRAGAPRLLDLERTLAAEVRRRPLSDRR
ncbi:MAG TPA: WhiB family transcriptional regulator [Propionibacteriaceae bacterium]|nr:WhiB family transcriptional regulator [Propionibacteriaceae bacterium]